MDGLTNAMRREAERVMQQRATNRSGIVTSYDEATYSAKVRIQPEDVETGWLPVRTPWSGVNWGMFCPPAEGDEVEVCFQEGGKQAAYIALRAFGDQFPPLPVPSREFWLVHGSGSFLKLKNDESVEIHAAGNLNVTVVGNANLSIAGNLSATVEGQADLTVGGNVTATAPEFNLNGEVNIDGDLLVTGDITDLNGAGGTVNRIREVYNNHYHPAPGGNTGLPIEQL